MKEISESTKMATSLISDYETGKKAIGMKVAIRFADYYNVSLNYLMRREIVPPANKMELLGIEKNVDDDEFMRLYNELA
ncbi:MAG: helix-turn-helix domain-containing protein [Ruminococcus sp.]|nr:helix-turn-helix domain-containing protein [Ruminococcus sp.]